jgi:hypothetical protein
MAVAVPTPERPQVHHPGSCSPQERMFVPIWRNARHNHLADVVHGHKPSGNRRQLDHSNLGCPHKVTDTDETISPGHMGTDDLTYVIDEHGLYLVHGPVRAGGVRLVQRADVYHSPGGAPHKTSLHAIYWCRASPNDLAYIVQKQWHSSIGHPMYPNAALHPRQGPQEWDESRLQCPLSRPPSLRC